MCKPRSEDSKTFDATSIQICIVYLLELDFKFINGPSKIEQVIDSGIFQLTQEIRVIESLKCYYSIKI